MSLEFGRQSVLVGFHSPGRRGRFGFSFGRRMAETQAGTPAFTLVSSLQRRKASGPPSGRARRLLAAPSLLALGRRPPALSPAPSACGGGRSPVFLSGDPAPPSSGVLPPKLPALLCPRPPLLQPRLGRLPGRLLQALLYPKELGGGREQVPDVRRAPRQHQHAGGTGLHQQWAGDREGGDPSSPALSATRPLTHQSVT